MTSNSSPKTSGTQPSVHAIRAGFLIHLAGTDHVVNPSSSLVPHGHSTLRFVNAGMLQLKNLSLIHLF